MEIEVVGRKLRRRCEQEPEATRAWGKRCARKLFQRLAEFEASETLVAVFKLPGARCHPLKGDRAGQFALDLFQARRLVFEPAGDLDVYMEGGTLRPERVTAVRILEVVDYHG